MGVSCVDCMTVVLSGWSCVCVQQSACLYVHCFGVVSSCRFKYPRGVLITECQILLLQYAPTWSNLHIDWAACKICGSFQLAPEPRDLIGLRKRLALGFS